MSRLATLSISPRLVSSLLSSILLPLLLSLLSSILWGCAEAETPADIPPAQAENRQGKDTHPSNLQPTDPDRHLILVADPWCPHNCKADARQEGYMIDIAREAMAEAGYTLEYQNFSWARALMMTREGHAHAVVGAFRTDAPDFIFPEIPQGRSSISLFTHPDSEWTFRGIASLEDQTLLAINGYSYSGDLDNYIARNQNSRERIWILSGPAPLKRALGLLAKNRADLFAEDDYVMAWAIRNDPEIDRPRRAGQVGESLSYVAFSPALENSRELARILAEGTRKLIENGRVDAILSGYGLIGLPERP